MTSTTTTVYCGNCGAVDLGTRFCEACGGVLRAAQAQIAIHSFPSAPAKPRAFTTAFRVYLAAYLAGILVWMVQIAGGNGWLTSEQLIVLAAVSVICALAMAGGLLVAAFASPVSLGRKAVGLTMVITQPLLLLFLAIADPSILWGLRDSLALLSGLVPFLLVLSWLLVTGLPSKSYLALPIVIPSMFGDFFLMWSGAHDSFWYIGAVILETAGVVIALIVARRLARGPSDRRPTPIGGTYAPLPGATPGTNTLAILALIFGVLGGTILPIIFGHIARSQIRRTGESGWGLAMAGLILGYLSSSVVLILIVAAIAVAAQSGTFP